MKDMRSIIQMIVEASPADLLDNPNFQNWFGKSKIVDQNGKPLVVYHGTNASFAKFEPRESIPLAEIGHWFAGHEDVARMVALRKGNTPTVYGAYLNIRNPKIIDVPGVDGLLGLIREITGDGDVTREKVQKYRRKLIANGYDGIVLRNVRADGGLTDNFIVFDADQIRLTAETISETPGMRNIMNIAENHQILYDVPDHLLSKGVVTFAGTYNPVTRIASPNMIDIHPAAARKGVGREAVQDFERWAKEQGAIAIRSGYGSWKGARGFWEKLGYKVAKRPNANKAYDFIKKLDESTNEHESMRSLMQLISESVDSLFLVENAFTADVLSQAQQNLIADMDWSGDYGYPEMIRQEFLDDTGYDPDDSSEEAQKAFTDFQQKWAEEQIENVLWNLRDTIKRGFVRAWRVITAPQDWDVKSRHPGVYWSWDKKAAQAHWGEFGNGRVKWRISALIPISSIDWVTTLAMNADPALGEDEKEIRIYDDAPVKIIGTKIIR